MDLNHKAAYCIQRRQSDKLLASSKKKKNMFDKSLFVSKHFQSKIVTAFADVARPGLSHDVVIIWITN